MCSRPVPPTDRAGRIGGPIRFARGNDGERSIIRALSGYTLDWGADLRREMDTPHAG